MAKSYEVKGQSDDGRVYVVVTLDDGSTFGQYIDLGTQAEMDAQVLAAAERLRAQAAPKPVLQVGTVRNLQVAAE